MRLWNAAIEPANITVSAKAQRRRQYLAAAVFAALVLPPLAATDALAQTSAYPTKPIRMVVPYTPGGFTDTMARLVGEPLSRALGQPVIFENKPGANSIIGTDLVAKAAPDGYTLVTVIAAHAVNPSLYPKLPFDTLKDLTQVALIGVAPVMLFANKEFGPNTVGEFISYARANPDKLNFGSSGNGAAAHLTMEYLMLTAGLKLQHIPYKGTAPALTGLLGNEINLMFDTTSPLINQVKAGKIKAIGIASEKRLRAAPDVPTFSESGVAGFASSTWAMVLAPAGLPRDILDRLSSELNRIIRSPAIQEKLDAQGVEPGGGTPEEVRAFLLRELSKWGKVVRDANVKLEN